MASCVTPIKALRKFLSKHPETREFASQAGLAQLIDRSESLVRAIEARRMRVSPKFAKALSVMTGVSKDWLLQDAVDSESVPAEHGGILSHGTVVARIGQQIQRNLNTAAVAIKEFDGKVDSGPELDGQGDRLSQVMAEQVANWVKAALADRLAKGDTRLMEEITSLLIAQSKSEKNE